MSAPAPVGPYSPVFRAGDWIIVSGQLGLIPEGNGAALASGFAAQADAALDNLVARLEEAGVGLESVAKTTVFVTDLADFPVLNEKYAARFGEHRPARSTVQVAALPLGGLVEIEAWAHSPR